MTARFVVFRSTVGRHAKSGNLSAIVDSNRVSQLQVGARSNQRIQVHHRSAFLPQKGMLADGHRAQFPVLRRADNLPTQIDVIRVAARVASEHAEIDCLAVPPKDSIVILRRSAGQIGFARNIAAIVDPVGRPVISSQRPQIDEVTSPP